MKRFAILITFLFTFLFTAIPAFADPYGSLKLGPTFLEDKDIGDLVQNYGTGIGASGAVGYNFGDFGIGKFVNFRAEVEGLYAYNSRGNLDKVITTKVPVPCEEAAAVKRGGKPKVCTEDQITSETVGGGGSVDRGFIFINAFADFPIYDNWNLYVGGGYGFDAYQIMGGASYAFAPQWSATTEIRVLKDDDDYTNPMLLFGVNYSF